ncbi:MAG TPA: PilZ domain-containing protein [Tepidisphaeraceae bacterium]|jgi:hypothetical protein
MLQFQESFTPEVAERRRGLRILQDRPVKVFEPAIARFLNGRTRDVSSTGLQLTFDTDLGLRPGRLINIAVGCEAGGGPLVNRRSLITACIVWTRPDLETEEGMIAGVEFLSNVTAFAGAA